MSAGRRRQAARGAGGQGLLRRGGRAAAVTMFTLRDLQSSWGRGILCGRLRRRARGARRRSLRVSCTSEAFAREHVLRGDLEAPQPGLAPGPPFSRYAPSSRPTSGSSSGIPRAATATTPCGRPPDSPTRPRDGADQEQDRRTATRLLRLLIAEYPSSSLVPKATRPNWPRSQPAPAATARRGPAGGAAGRLTARPFPRPAANPAATIRRTALPGDRARHHRAGSRGRLQDGAA